MGAKVVNLHDFILFDILNTLCQEGIISPDMREKIKQYMEWEGRTMPAETNKEEIINDILNLREKSEKEIEYEQVKIQAGFTVDKRNFPIAGLRAEMLTNEESILVRYVLFRLLKEMFLKTPK